MAEIIGNRKIGPGYYLIKFRAPAVAEQVKAGQFIHLKITEDNEATDPLLRRPFSIFDCNPVAGSITLVYRIVGRGTKILSRKVTGADLDILGPLGNGFTTEIKDRNLVLVGGGAGIAPLFLLARKLVPANRLQVLLGAANKSEIHFFNRKMVSLNVEVMCSTIDGSSGYKGTVVELFRKEILKPGTGHGAEIDYIYTCGPKPMLGAVQKLAEKQGLAGEVSLEERMGCGTGVCLSCVCQTTSGHKRVCKEGPVFPLDEVIFDD